MTTTQAEPQAGTLEHVAPGTLLLKRNIREAKPSTDLVDSIKSVGVLEPVTAVTSDDGLVIRYGHRRVLAAIEAGLDTIPVYVCGADDLETDAEVLRVISQLDENTVRDGLTAADEVGVVEQLVAFGLSAEEITKQARLDRGGVDRAITVSKSKLASSAAAKYEALTLEQAATVAEFEDDTDLAKNLIVTAIERPGNFDHMAQRARDDRARRDIVREATEQAKAKGLTVIERPAHDAKVKNLEYIVDSTGGEITAKNHKNCPGHVVWFTAFASGGKAVADYGCSDPKKYGHKPRWSASGGGSVSAADMTPAEREKASKARKLVIENNKAWDSAQTVRRYWLANLAKRKAAPKGAAAYICHVLAEDAHTLQDYNHRALAKEWLGSEIPAAAEKASEARALLVALVQVLSAVEYARSRQDWRQNGKSSSAGHYLRYLESIGYTLSDVEQYAVSSKTGN